MPACKSFVSEKDRIFDETGKFEPRCCGNRVAAIKVRKGRQTFSVNLGGIYSTDFRLRDGRVLAETESITSDTSVVWSLATFVGYHRILGDIQVRLAPRESIGTFEPVGKALFPTVNTNEFYFHITLPRFGKTYANRIPLVNRAEIREIPPHGSLYELVSSTRFENPVNPNDWIDITKCYVMMPDRKDIEIDVISIVPDGNRYHVQATLENRSQSDSVEAYWFTHSEDPFNHHYEPDMGALKLKRQKVLVSFDLVFSSPPKDPVIQIGAALISNPIVDDPHMNTGTNLFGVNLRQRMAYLQRGAPG